jgi:hypothetical protein
MYYENGSREESVDLSHEQYEKELADMGPIRNLRGTPLIEYHF